MQGGNNKNQPQDKFTLTYIMQLRNNAELFRLSLGLELSFLQLMSCPL